MLTLDCQYIDHWSLWLDLEILARTVLVVLLDWSGSY
jgi:lipopolysaccharide/colanic/teichoic acid biosynthesis glycosyltransferase